MDGRQAWCEASTLPSPVAHQPEPLPPGAIQAEPRPYQYDGFAWLSFLRTNGLGGILADDMGLGKTL
ncbi:MAG: SNF2-related protein, partial [Actinomycetales bacterium]